MTKVNGYILAGGKSLRMGVDKGLLLIEDKAMVQLVANALKQIVDKVVIVSNNPVYEKFGFEVIQDLIQNIGPAGGIYTALNHTTTDKNFVVSCDMPFINSNAIKFIIDNSLQFEITLPFHNHKLEPLFGVYSKSCLARWKELIDKGIIKMHDLVAHFNLLKLNVETNMLFEEKLFLNLNTREEFESVKQKWR